MKNFEKYPEFFSKPEKRNAFDFYGVSFKNIYELYYFLKTDPEINKSVFWTQASLKNKSDFAGKPYEEALEDLNSSESEEIDAFLEVAKELGCTEYVATNKYKTVKRIAGGVVNVPSYLAGSPFCYRSIERVYEPKFVRIFVRLSYDFTTTKKQVINRAIIIINILKALEDAGYLIDLNTFDLSYVDNEMIYINVGLKDLNEKLNIPALYNALCHVEFNRRILFRLKELTDIRSSWWAHSYGTIYDTAPSKAILGLGENDILFDSPNKASIYGDDLYTDFETCVRNLDLSEVIDLESAKEGIMKLSRK